MSRTFFTAVAVAVAATGHAPHATASTASDVPVLQRIATAQAKLGQLNEFAALGQPVLGEQPGEVRARLAQHWHNGHWPNWNNWHNWHNWGDHHHRHR